jgi:hypothetical protein
MTSTRRLIFNIVAVNVGWTACILAAARGHASTGPIVVIMLVGCHLAFVRRSRRELVLLAAVTVTGTIADSIMTWLGLLRFDTSGPWGLPLPLPLWMSALWLNFATTLNVALRFLTDRLVLGSMLGAVGGAGAYLGGVRFGALSFHPDTWPSVLGVAVEWLIVTPALVTLAASLRRDASRSCSAVKNGAMRGAA